jgi:hypothetical protein
MLTLHMRLGAFQPPNLLPGAHPAWFFPGAENQQLAVVVEKLEAARVR